jgi:hypothetical protein
VSGGESEDESVVNNRVVSTTPSTTFSTTMMTEVILTTTETPRNLTLSCDSDHGGCDHNCQMVKYHFDPEPVIECSCREGFLLDENDMRRCHGKFIFLHFPPFCLLYSQITQVINFLCFLLDINECENSAHGCEQICNNLPGSFECACHPGLRIDPINIHKCVGKFRKLRKFTHDYSSK